jgi:hypothetical protein
VASVTIREMPSEGINLDDLAAPTSNLGLTSQTRSNLYKYSA